jgi:hypothetical protein
MGGAISRIVAAVCDRRSMMLESIAHDPFGNTIRLNQLAEPDLKLQKKAPRTARSIRGVLFTDRVLSFRKSQSAGYSRTSQGHPPAELLTTRRRGGASTLTNN